MPNGIGSRLAQARLDKLPGRTKEADCVCELIGLRIDLIWVALTVWIVYWNFALSLSLYIYTHIHTHTNATCAYV